MYWVMKYFDLTEYSVSRWLGFRGGPITIIRRENFTNNDMAVFVALFKLQSTWPHPLKWTEAKYKEGEYLV